MKTYKTQSFKLQYILTLGVLVDVSNTLSIEGTKRNLKPGERAYLFTYNEKNTNHDFISFEMSVFDIKVFINTLYPLLES